MVNRIFVLSTVLSFSLLPIVSSIRCYSGMKLIVGQDRFSGEATCEDFLGIEAYCYKFVEETAVQEAITLGCSKMLCHGIRNSCFPTEVGGMKGKACCCNDRHYCNSTENPKGRALGPTTCVVLFISFVSVFVRVMLTDSI